MIKAYFLDYLRLQGNLSISLASGAVSNHGRRPDDWTVHLIDTGLQSMTGGRIKRLEPWLGGSTFMLTYGDGVSDVDLRALSAFHRAHGRLATVTAVRPPARFGGLVSDASGRVTQFIEKPQIGEGWINGGYMVLEPGVLDRLREGRARATRGRGGARRLPARPLLAVHGHAPGQAAARGPLGERPGALEGMDGLNGAQRPGTAADHS
jgi:glucose-1-phosphate cytidylyltransferase